MKNTVHHLFRCRALLGLVLAFCFSSRSGLADASPAQTSAESQSPPVRVACVGDSITHGFGLQNRALNSYPADLGRWLGAGWDVRNFGVNGATLLKKGDLPYFKQKAHAEALAFKPDIAVIMLGTNDSKHRDDGSLDADHAVNNWQYRADYVPDYEALIAGFRQANPAVKVYVCLPTPCFPGRWGINDKTIHDEIIPMVRQVAQETHATIIDLYAALSGKGDLFPDTVHPNKEGARLMAAAIYHALTGRAPPAAAAWMAPQREKLKAEIVESLYRGSGFGFDGSTL